MIHTKMKTPSSNITMMVRGRGGGGKEYMSKHFSCLKGSHLLASPTKLRFPGLSPLHKIMVIYKIQSDVFQKWTYTGSPTSGWGMLLSEWYPCGVSIVILNLALNLGSSKQGKALLACVGSNWVAASHLQAQVRISSIPLFSLQNNFSYISVTSILKCCSCSVCFKNCIRCFEHNSKFIQYYLINMFWPTNTCCWSNTE
jgi:hypothetical protein